MPTFLNKHDPKGTLATLTGLSTAKGFGSVPDGAKSVTMYISGANVRYCDEGTTPTATVGIPLFMGQVVTYEGDLSAIRFIEESASATIQALFYSGERG